MLFIAAAAFAASSVITRESKDCRVNLCPPAGGDVVVLAGAVLAP